MKQKRRTLPATLRYFRRNPICSGRNARSWIESRKPRLREPRQDGACWLLSPFTHLVEAKSGKVASIPANPRTRQSIRTARVRISRGKKMAAIHQQKKRGPFHVDGLFVTRKIPPSSRTKSGTGVDPPIIPHRLPNTATRSSLAVKNSRPYRLVASNHRFFSLCKSTGEQWNILIPSMTHSSTCNVIYWKLKFIIWMKSF